MREGGFAREGTTTHGGMPCGRNLGAARPLLFGTRLGRQGIQSRQTEDTRDETRQSSPRYVTDASSPRFPD